MNNEIVITNNTPEEISINQNENQTITISSGGNVIGIIDVKVNGNSVVVGNTAYVIVPTKLSELQNDTHFITQESDPTVPSYVKAISVADINNWNNKQNTLVSGTNIKTINNESLLGDGNINISGTQYSAGTGININNDIISNEITSYNDLTDLPTIPTKTSDLLNDNNFVSSNQLSDVAFDGSYTSLSNTPAIPVNTSELTNDGNGTYPFMLNKSSSYLDGIGTYGGSSAYARNLAYTWDNGIISEDHIVANYDDLNTKQDTLVSGSNIKTINNMSLLGSGDLTIQGTIYSGGNEISISNNVISTNFEKGTFTPIIKGNTSDGTVTYIIQNGSYTKIGNIVFYDFKIGVSSVSNASGVLEIHGLPYMYNQIFNASSVNSVIVAGDLFTMNGGNTIRLIWNGSNFCITDSNNGIGALYINNTSTNNYIYSTGFYFVN